MDASLARLADNERAQETRRKPDGRLAGSQPGHGARHPRHLLSGLLRCEACGATLHVAGAGAKYLRCPNWAKGVCQCKTQVRRDRAERMILEAVGQRMFSNPTWLHAVFEETVASWKAQEECRPNEVQKTEKGLAEIERKISRLVDSIEDGNDSPEVSKRLAERRKDRIALAKELEQLSRTEVQRQRVPSLHSPESCGNSKGFTFGMSITWHFDDARLRPGSEVGAMRWLPGVA